MTDYNKGCEKLELPWDIPTSDRELYEPICAKPPEERTALEALAKKYIDLCARAVDERDVNIIRAHKLEAQLSLLQWTVIEEGNLPKVGDELWGPRTKVMIMPAIYAPQIAVPNDFTFAGWTHFRKFHPPAPPTDKEQK